MARFSSPSDRQSNSRTRSSMSKAPKSPDKSRLLGRNRLISPLKKIRTRHRCTCEPRYQSPTSEEHLGFSEYREEDQFSDVDDGIQEHQDQDDEDDSAYSDWDEHATLIALLDDGEGAPDFDDGAAIVDLLQPAFTAHGRDAKERFRETLVPVITRVGEAHKLFSHEIHPTFFRGAALFQNSSRALEDAARREHDQVISTFSGMKDALEGLSFQFQDVCAESDELFDAYEKVINKHVQRVRDYAKSVPGDIERLISKLDKSHKSVAAEDHAKAKEKLLRGILDRY
ncbi:hypothetical protein DFH29DRAFT_908793 [Suillus ampliporus]|nr:hypothetical protein DFH29DRAFT_908793 [Suillus ampliporus]